jgi:hypothetical protein
MDSINFILDNQRLLDSPGFSAILSQFDLERGAPIEKNPAEWGIKNLYTPPEHDLSLGYSYETTIGMNSEEITELYQQLIEKLGREVMTFPHNYSLSDGLLYLAHHQHNSLTERLLALA